MGLMHGFLIFIMSDSNNQLLKILSLEAEKKDNLDLKNTHVYNFVF